VTIKTILSNLNSFFKQKCKNLLFCVIAVLPPNIFMFHLYSRNAECVDYWHVFIVSAVFSIGGLLLYWVISRIRKSPQGSALVCVFLWVMFFTLLPILHLCFGAIKFWNSSLIYKFFFFTILVIPVLALTVILFKIGKCIKHIEVFKILAVFETVVFLFNFILSSVIYTSEKIDIVSENNYKTSFVVESGSPSPNIYWLHMDGMLGFKAMEYFFDDPQIEFETQLNERGFLVNREAGFEVEHLTAYAIPALMSPFFYDNVMLSVVLNKRDFLASVNSIAVFRARLNNELITAFKAKGYQTNTIASMSIYGLFFPTTNVFYYQNVKIDNEVTDLRIIEQWSKMNNLIELMYSTTPLAILRGHIHFIVAGLYKEHLNLELIRKSDIDINKMYSKYRDYDIWQINALSEIFDGHQPRMTIIHDLKAHYPFRLTEEGFSVIRTQNEGLDINNYPPQHRFIRSYLIALVGLIVANDPDAIIVVQADHGLHSDNSRKQILSSGGTEEEVRLIYNQTMSAVRIPDKWGGLDAPLDPLNITRVLVNRYVGQNYELLEDHP